MEPINSHFKGVFSDTKTPEKRRPHLTIQILDPTDCSPSPKIPLKSRCFICSASGDTRVMECACQHLFCSTHKPPYMHKCPFTGGGAPTPPAGKSIKRAHNYL